MTTTSVENPAAGGMRAAAPMEIYWVTTDPGLKSLEREWRALAERDPASTVFQSWEWTDSWWAAFGEGRQVRVVAARVGDRLVGLVPLVARRLAGLRLLEFLGAGRSDYLRILVDPEWPAARGRLLAALDGRSSEWDVLWLRDMPLSEEERTQLEVELAAAGLRGRVRPWDSAPYLDTTSTWQSYLAGRSANFRSDLKRKRRRLEQGGGCSIERFRDRDAVRAALLEAMDIERRSWKQEAGTARMAAESGQRFFLEVTDALSRPGWVDLWLLRCGPIPVAFYLNFIYRNRVCYYSGTYRSDFGAMSPGKVLMAEALRAAFDERRERFDFLRGEESYKALWTDQSRTLYEAFIGSARLRSRMARWLLGDLALPIKRHAWGRAVTRAVMRRHGRQSGGRPSGPVTGEMGRMNPGREDGDHATDSPGG